MTRTITATATRTWRIAVATLVSALLAGGAFMAISPDTASAATCPHAESPVIAGGIAHWTLTCSGRNITMRGFVVDTAADGRCAQVTATVGGRPHSSPRACPKDDVKTFVWTERGSQASGFLRSVAGRG
jgi:hypothetical protein